MMMISDVNHGRDTNVPVVVEAKRTWTMMIVGTMMMIAMTIVPFATRVSVCPPGVVE